MNIYEHIVDIRNERNIGLIGMTNEFFCIYILNLYIKEKRDILVLTSTLYEANKLNNILQSYSNDTLLFPMDDFLTIESIAMSPELKMSRLDTLKKINSGGTHILITHLDAFMRKLPKNDVYKSKTISLNKGNVYNRESLINDLYEIGYQKDTIVTNTGEFATRGYIIDIFPTSYENPIRIEFFGDEIDSIRTFNVETQFSISELNSIIIDPNTEDFSNSDTDYKSLSSNICDYLDNPLLLVKDFSQIKSTYEKLVNDIFEYSIKEPTCKSKYIDDLFFALKNVDIYYNSLENIFSEKNIKNVYNYDVKKIENFNENIEKINQYLKYNIKNGKTIIIALKEFQIKNFAKYLECQYVITDEYNIKDGKVNLIEKDMVEGFGYKDYIFLSPNELFKNKLNSSKYKSKFKYSSKVKNIEALEIGDYVVHSINGIGIYQGIKTLTKNSLKKDYLEIQYYGNDKLYIPVEKIDLISKYSGKEGTSPKIHKLGGTEWYKTKLRVKAKVHDIAKKLLEISAERSLEKGIQFSKDDEMQVMFENEFPYDETRDQLVAIKQIKNDMESIKPMDRLLCGDVGYGKTEVAFRAMFKAVANSKQVLYLCPTTILSKQQYENARLRFKNYPVNIEIMNRFSTHSDVNRILEGVKNGTVDILFGTHRILSEDIKPKNLGLLVVDEEQRFGVIHKEKMKEYKKNIDILTLTATPIPRTLQMSLVGLRSLSLIETPPNDRYPVQTYVIEENKQLMRDAIYKEMSRNGQVYILYNKVEGIQEKVREIQGLVPDAKIICAHGQLNKTELEDRMLDFINYRYDILVCTTIIETGIDIPNVNTLIILDADRFGLSQLYQIRGRVGRSNKIAYSYLMYSKDKVLNEIALKRLNAIKEFTELGSGYSIASRDLSIRGAGDILGSEQAGFIDSVGINLYLKILNDEVKRLKGEKVIEDDANENTNLLEVETHISDDYVKETDLKIEIHKIINEIDSYDKLVKTKFELEDRFGKLSEELLIYMYEEWFEKLAKKLQIFRVLQTKQYIEITFDKNISSKIDGEQLFMDAFKINPNFNFKYKNNYLSIILNITSLEKHYLYFLTELLSKIENCIMLSEDSSQSENLT